MFLSLSWWLWDWVCVVSRRTPFSVPTKHASTMMYYASMTEHMKVITIRVPESLHSKVHEDSREERRSMTAYIRVVLEAHFAAKENEEE